MCLVWCALKYQKWCRSWVTGQFPLGCGQALANTLLVAPLSVTTTTKIPSQSFHQHPPTGFQKLRTRYWTSPTNSPQSLFSARLASESHSWPVPSWTTTEPKPDLVKIVTSCVVTASQTRWMVSLGAYLTPSILPQRNSSRASGPPLHSYWCSMA